VDEHDHHIRSFLGERGRARSAPLHPSERKARECDQAGQRYDDPFYGAIPIIWIDVEDEFQPIGPYERGGEKERADAAQAGLNPE
jgi:hypothetical protein